MINFEYLYKAGLTDKDYMLMVKIFQKNLHLIHSDEKEDIEQLIDKGYLTLIKTGKTFRDKLRISEKGKVFLDNLSIPDVTDEVLHTEDRLRSLYEEHDKVIDKDVRKKLAWFMAKTGFSSKSIINVVQNHLENDNYAYTLSNLLWKAPNVYAVKWSLDSSPLFEMICKTYNLKHTTYTDTKDRELHFLFKFGATLPPKGLPSEMYFKGSYEADCEHIVKLTELLTNKIRKTPVSP